MLVNSWLNYWLKLVNEYLGIIINLKASPLPPAPLAVAGFMVAGLMAWQYYDRLAGLLDFAVWLLFVGVFAGSLVSGCGGLAIF